MAYMQLGTDATDKLFLEFIGPGMHIQFVKNTILYDRFKTKTETCLGVYGVAKVQTSASKSARPSSTPYYPTAKQGRYTEFTFFIKRGMYSTLEFDGLAIACGKGKGAVKDIVQTEIEGQMIYISNRLNRQYWGDGSGRLARLAAAVSASATVTVDGPLHGQDTNEYTPPSKYIEEYQNVDIYNASGVRQVNNKEMSTISLGGAGTDTITMEEAVSADDNSFIFDVDTYATAEGAGTGVPMGLWGIINTANQTVGITALSAFQGVNRSSNSWAQAQLFNNGSAVITNKVVLADIQTLEKNGTIGVIITNGAIWRNWAEILWGDKTMPNDPVFWGGIAGMGFYAGRKKQVPIIWDDDCPDQNVVYIDDTKIIISSPNNAGLEWQRGDGGRILYRVQGADLFAANLRSYYNMTSVMPQSLGRRYGVTHTSS